MHHPKYLFVIPTLEVGGAERQVISQVNELYRRGKNITLVVLSETGKNNNVSHELNIPKERCIFLRSNIKSLIFYDLAKIFFFLPLFSSILKNKGIDIVISNLPIAHNFVRFSKVYYYLRYFKSIKIIHYHHSLQYQASLLNSISKKIFNKIISILARIVDNGNIFISEATLKDISSNMYINYSSTCIIHNAVPKKSVNKDLAEKYLKERGINTKVLCILPGRLSRDKGQIEFIDVFNSFISNNNLLPENIHVIFAGGGDLEVEIKNKISKLGLENYITITGILNNLLLLSLMKNASIVIIPSINEGFGIVAIEALMTGSLILASDAGGLKEIIKNGENGYSFERNNWNQLEEKLQFIYYHISSLNIEKDYLIKDFDLRFSFENHIRRLEDFLLKFI
jgi:glycosyltransferase involved in cell wall biosynthesis